MFPRLCSTFTYFVLSIRNYVPQNSWLFYQIAQRSLKVSGPISRYDGAICQLKIEFCLEAVCTELGILSKIFSWFNIKDNIDSYLRISDWAAKSSLMFFKRHYVVPHLYLDKINPLSVPIIFIPFICFFYGLWGDNSILVKSFPISWPDLGYHLFRSYIIPA